MLVLTQQGMDAQRKVCIDSDWMFRLGDGKATEAQVGEMNDWRALGLPHDWSVETEAAEAIGGEHIGPFSQQSVGKYQTGHTVGGEGWYMKKLTLTKKELKSGRRQLYFEGAYNQTDVWVNGRKMYFNPLGYISFRFDVTDALHEGENVILVRVVNSGNNTRWYAGSGIYRHVWLISTPDIAVDEWGTFISTENNNKIKVRSQIDNHLKKAVDAEVTIDILDGGDVVASRGMKIKSAAGEATAIETEIPLSGAKTWSTENPNLYTARISVKAKKKTDVLTKKFGFRTIEYSAEKGLQLNGKSIYLRGGCVHHDHGLLGAAAYDRAVERKVKLLKNQGYNALRTSHNLPEEHFLDVCDSLGIMVIDETFDQWLRKKNDNDYHRFFREHHKADLETMIRRDRNHPSVIMWSIGNEIPGRIEPEGMEVAREMRETILALDNTRPITAAICTWDEGDAWNARGHEWNLQDERAFQSLDIGGYNYLYYNYERDHRTHPDRVICGLESFPKQIAENWQMVEKHPYVIGDFIWTAMDYLGEAGIGSAGIRAEGNQSMFQDWPWYNGWCGDIDLIGQKKPQSYYHDVVWNRLPVAMAVERPIPEGHHQSISAWGWQLEEQNWTFPKYNETDTMSVNVYSKAPKVRLYLNGKAIGEKAPGTTYWAGFAVPYQPGSLRAVNLDANGNEKPGETFELKSTGKPAAIRLTADRSVLNANNPQDLAYITIEVTDNDGNVVVSDECSGDIVLNITAEGNGGTLLVSGNASPTDMESFRSPTPRPFRGRALAIVKSSGKEGNIMLKVGAAELKSAELLLKVE